MTHKKRKLLQIVVLVIVYVISRAYILGNPPVTYDDPTISGVNGGGYSDVQHDYERYANIWRYSLVPYLQHAFEYPPGAIPLMYFPLMLDQAGIGHYYPDYRAMIAVLEIIFFIGLIWLWVTKGEEIGLSYGSLWMYVVLTFLAKSFLYDGIDTPFALTYAAGLIWRYAVFPVNSWRARIGGWIFFWLSTAIKVMTAPLGLFLILLERKWWKREFGAALIGFTLVWGFPIIRFRSALSVPFVINAQRPFKYGSMGTFIIKTVNEFTHTEQQSDLKPNFPMVGPVSTQVEAIFSWLFPLVIGIFFILCSRFLLINYKRMEAVQNRYGMIIKLSMAYFLLLFVTAKIFSNPFHLWYIPLVVLFPYASNKQKWLVFLLATWMIVFDLTPWIRLPDSMIVGYDPWQRIRDLMRFIPMFLFLGLSLRIKSLGKKAHAY